MKDLQFNMEDLRNTGHKFQSQLTNDTQCGSTSSVMKRLTKEMQQLKRDLPLHLESSIMVRCDESNPQLIKALITGPRKTPYDGGCFEFDLYCGSKYPSRPPSVSLVTTGGGSVRFNPNLYNCGKVCLSLLGTWSGDNASQNWSPSQSGIWQVLVSIQSAILGVEFPYFNEPGVESTKGTHRAETMKRTSENGGFERLRIATIRFAMAEQLRSGSKVFEKTIRQHFSLRREQILWTLYLWLAEAYRSPTANHFGQLANVILRDLFPQFRALSDRIDIVSVQMLHLTRYYDRMLELKHVKSRNRTRIRNRLQKRLIFRQPKEV